MYHGPQTIGCKELKKTERLFCFYRLPTWVNDILVFKCREQYCSFELRVFLNEDMESQMSSFSERSIHRCHIKCSNDEVIWILEEEGDHSLGQKFTSNYYNFISKSSQDFTNPCLNGHPKIQYASTNQLSGLLRKALKVEYKRQKRLNTFEEANLKRRAKQI